MSFFLFTKWYAAETPKRAQKIVEENQSNFGFISKLEAVIKDRYDNQDQDSYTSSLFRKGINKVAQKVGEEAVEVVIEAKDNDEKLFLDESADLLYHYLILECWLLLALAVELGILP